MRAFLEQLDGEWLDDFVYISKYPLIERGYEIIPFDGEVPMRGFRKYGVNADEDICIGSVDATMKFFNLCGVRVPKYIGYPDSLKEFLGRDIIDMAFSELGDNYPYFIKPYEDVKLFTGDVLESGKDKDFLRIFYDITENLRVYKSEYISFISEYRVFVSRGEIRGIKHYRGDFTKFININIVDKMVSVYNDGCPSAYTLDVGLTSDGRTLLVEVNDMWAIGSYGLDGKTYALLCERRMKEILKNRI